MIALDGPFEGKEYRNVPEGTKTLIDNYRTEMDFYQVTYERTDKGWKFVKEDQLFTTLVEKLSEKQEA